jgi:hypothetical protein
LLVYQKGELTQLPIKLGVCHPIPLNEKAAKNGGFAAA